jgi:hypothetical protein
MDLVYLNAFGKSYPIPKDKLNLSGLFGQENNFELNLDRDSKLDFEIIYNYLLTGKLPEVDFKTLISVAILSDYFNIPTLSDEIYKRMVSQLTVENIVHIPENILEEVLLYNNYDSTMNFCQANIEVGKICDDPIFWQRKAQRDFGITSNKFRDTNLSADQRYLQLLTKMGGVAIGSEKYINWQEFAFRAAKEKNRHLILYTLKNGKLTPDNALWTVAVGGWKDLVDIYLSLKPNYLEAAGGAAYGGNIELFDYIRSLVSPFVEWQWNNSAQNALSGGHQYMIDHIYNLAGCEDYPWNWTALLASAARSGNIDLFNHVFSLFPGYVLDWSIIAEYAASSGNKDLFDYVLSLGYQDDPEYEWDWLHIASAAVSKGHGDLFDYIISKDDDWDWNYLAMIAVRNNNGDLLHHIILLAPNYEWNWNVLTPLANDREYQEIVDYIKLKSSK